MTPVEIVNKAIPTAPPEYKADLLIDIVTYTTDMLNKVTKTNFFGITIDKKLMTEYFESAAT